jgi:HemY protein
MKLLWFSLITLFTAVVMALLVMEDPGYVLIAVGQWSVESSLALLGAVLIIAFVVCYYSVRLLVRLWGVPKGVRHWRSQRREHRAHKGFNRGLVELAQGEWSAAERHMVKSAENGEQPLLNYLAAARAAQEQGADGRRDRYLKLANEQAPDAQIAVGLTQVELQLQQGQQEQALASLRHLQQLAPKHPQVLKALANLYGELGDWESLLDLLPILRRRRVFTTQALDTMTREAYGSLLATSQRPIQEVWAQIPKALHEDASLIACYVRRMMEQGRGDLAESILRHAINRRRNEELLFLYGLIEGADPSQQLVQAEVWLVEHEQDATNLLTAGRLALRAKLWGKAREYLEASVNVRPSAEAHNELGNLLEQQGELEAALENYRQGLRLVPGCGDPVPIRVGVGEIPALPQAAQ